MTISLSNILAKSISASTSSSAPVVTDPYYSSVSLLLHMDGSNGTQVLVDNSPTPKTATAIGAGTALSTSTYEFGTASLYCPGSDANYLNVDTSNQFNFGSGDFTVECWVNAAFSGRGSNSFALSTRTGDGNDGWVFAILTTGGLAFVAWNASSVVANFSSSAGVVAENTWQNICVTRQSGTYRIFANGTLVATNSASLAAIGNSGSSLVSKDASSGGRYFQGYMDEVRITKGVARYTASYSVATSPFPNS